MNVSRRNNPTAFAAISFVAKAWAREANPTNKTWNPTVALTTAGYIFK